MTTASTTPAALLEINDVSVRFAGITAVRDVSLRYTEPGIFGLIGPNGAGKSTLLGVVSGLVRADVGDVALQGTPILDLAPYEVARLGVARSFQTPRLMGTETVFTNILIGRYRLSTATFAQQLFRARNYRAEEHRDRAAAEEIGTALGFSSRDLNREAESLPFGMRRLVEVARALVSDASLVLLDEPAAGLARQERLDLATFLKAHVASHSKLILLTEHDVDLVRRLCVQLVVMDSGAVIANGLPTLPPRGAGSGDLGGVSHA